MAKRKTWADEPESETDTRLSADFGAFPEEIPPPASKGEFQVPELRSDTDMLRWSPPPAPPERNPQFELRSSNPPPVIKDILHEDMDGAFVVDNNDNVVVIGYGLPEPLTGEDAYGMIELVQKGMRPYDAARAYTDFPDEGGAMRMQGPSLEEIQVSPAKAPPPEELRVSPAPTGPAANEMAKYPEEMPSRNGVAFGEGQGPFGTTTSAERAAAKIGYSQPPKPVGGADLTLNVPTGQPEDSEARRTAERLAMMRNR